MYYGKFDKGGKLKPGVTLAVNNTGGDETVLSGNTIRLHPDDLRQLAGLVAKAQVKELSERGKFLAALNIGRQADLIAIAG